jgi:uncharacterized protein
MGELKINQSANYINSGKGPTFQVIDIGHKEYSAIIEADTAFWALIPAENSVNIFSDKNFINSYNTKKDIFETEMQKLRFGLKPSAVYFNPTELCNFDCKYCYIPQDLRRNGENMSRDKLSEALDKLKAYFDKTISLKRNPQIIFHGSEPLLNKEAVFYAIEKYSKDFDFGIQTNATLLDKEAVDFLKKHNCSIGISLDGHIAEIADKNRKNWEGKGFYNHVVNVMENLKGYKKFSVICTLTKENISHAVDIIDFFHKHHVEICLLNILRCTQPYSRTLKPDEKVAAKHFIDALEHSHKLFKETGRKIVVANFANIILSVVAPTARKLMCDISPCGGGRCFFAVSAKGDVFPCSEFIGLEEFNSGNIFEEEIENILKTEQIEKVTSRMVENINPCDKCAIRHFCGAPCPAEAFNMNGGRDKTGAFCEFYEEQVRYVFRLIADNKFEDFLYDNWDKDAEETFNLEMFGKR